MNIHTFHNNYIICPICQESNRNKNIKTCTGLFTCPYCQQKLVVCKSGHYVRDSFTCKKILISSALRRQSRPLARMIRDLSLVKSYFLALTMGSAILFTTIAITQERTNSNQQVLPRIEKVTVDSHTS